MPWSPAAHRFFELCRGPARAKARKPCPKPADAKRMAADGIKRKAKR